MLFVLFFFSGAAALIYEVLWLKDLGLLFGNTAYAAATTLAVFFLGMASGSWAFGLRAERLARPLRAYALLEWGIAGAALLYFLLNPLSRWIFAGAYPVLGQNLALMTLLKFVLSLGLLFPPAFLMGGTLPVMGQHLIRRNSELGRTGTLLYLVNTVGAATGALVAGFALPAWLGFRNSYFVAIAANVLVGFVAWRLAARAASEAPSGLEEDAADAAGPARREAATSGSADRAAGGTDEVEVAVSIPDERGLATSPAAIRTLSFLSGFLVLGLEVLWTRMFAQVLHNSVYSFTVILVTFLVALALGSGVANLLCRRPSLRPGPVLAVIAVASWLLVTGSTLNLLESTNGLGDVLAGGGFAGYVLRISLLTVAVMLLPGIAMGSIYPYLLKVSESLGKGPGYTIGNLAAVNSVGGVLGSLVAGFVLLEVFGLWTSAHILAAGYLAVAVVALAGALSRRVALGAAAAVAVASIVVSVSMPNFPVVRLNADEGETLVESWQGRHGIVAVIDRGGIDRYIRLDNNYVLGGGEALDAELRQSQLPLFILPPPESVFFLGMGTGITAGGALGFPVKRVVTCELVPEVVTASRRHFGELTNGLFQDPRSEVVIEDGRHFLAGTRERFDVIISDLFVPWHAGTGTLYTREHFEICRSRLNEGGHFVLWVPVSMFSRAEFDIVARTILSVFPYVTAWRGEFVPSWPTLALICSTRDWRLDPVQVRRNVANVITDRAPERITDSDVLPYLNYAGNLGACRSLFSEASLNTDDRPVIEYLSPKTQRRAVSEQEAWLTDYELVNLQDEMFADTPPARDPFLTEVGPEQIAYVRAGQQLYTVGVHVEAERITEAAPLYREFLATVPFDIFPGLAAQ